MKLHFTVFLDHPVLTISIVLHKGALSIKTDFSHRQHCRHSIYKYWRQGPNNSSDTVRRGALYTISEHITTPLEQCSLRSANKTNSEMEIYHYWPSNHQSCEILSKLWNLVIVNFRTWLGSRSPTVIINIKYIFLPIYWPLRNNCEVAASCLSCFFVDSCFGCQW